MTRRRSVAVLCGLAWGCTEPPPPATAPAEPVASPRPTAAVVAGADDDPRGAEAMARGREAFADRRWDDAVAAFEQALVWMPDDPRALCELGWAALHRGAPGWSTAEPALERAIEIARDPKLAGACWYNLGRLREDQGRRAEAARAYETSLSLREHAAVRRRLAKLRDPAATGRPKIDVEPLGGPWTTLEAWCEAFEGGGERAACKVAIDSREGLEVTTPLFTEDDGIVGASFVARTRDGGTDEVRVAIRTAAGWFVGPPIGEDGPAVHGIRFELSHLALETLDLVRGGGPELLVRVRGRTIDLDDRGKRQAEDVHDDRRLCGVGASGIPSCTSPIPLVGSSRSWTDGGATIDVRWALGLEIGAGAIVLTGDRDALDLHHRAWLGKHTLAFR